MIAANLLNIDVLGLLVGENLSWHRGWTYGPIALLVLPILLVLAMLAFDRWQTSRGTRPEARPPVLPYWLLTLAYVAIVSHPQLDFFNTYGIRCLMPFSDRWFYGDAVFIVDVWMWSALAVGVWLARRRQRRSDAHVRRPAVAALDGVTLYAGAMWAASAAAEDIVACEVAARGLGVPRLVVASHIPINPFRRSVVFTTGSALGFGELSWLPTPHLSLAPRLVATNMSDPAVAAAAARDGCVADFLYWSRLPFAEMARRPGEARVTVGDARYNEKPEGRFSVQAVVPEWGRFRLRAE